VGGTKIAACVVDLQGKILSSIRRPTDVTRPDATLDCIAGSVKELMAASRLDSKSIDAIGFGIPGLVDAETGIPRQQRWGSGCRGPGSPSTMTRMTSCFSWNPGRR